MNPNPGSLPARSDSPPRTFRVSDHHHVSRLRALRERAEYRDQGGGLGSTGVPGGGTRQGPPRARPEPAGRPGAPCFAQFILVVALEVQRRHVIEHQSGGATRADRECTRPQEGALYLLSARTYCMGVVAHRCRPLRATFSDNAIQVWEERLFQGGTCPDFHGGALSLSVAS
jgi:hypothetical protein